MTKSTETKRLKRRLIVYEVLFIVLLPVAGIGFFVNHTFAVISIPILLAGLISAALYLRLSLINNGSTHRAANSWGIVLAIPSVIICGCLFCIEISHSDNESTKPKVHFVLSLSTEDDPDDSIELTNDFLFMANQTNHTGFVFFPIHEGQTNIGLHLNVVNDSSNTGEFLKVVVFVPKKLKCVPGPDWRKWIPISENEAHSALGEYESNSPPHSQSWVFNAPEPLLPGTGGLIDMLQISWEKQTLITCTMGLKIMAKDISPSILRFRLAMILISTNLPPNIASNFLKPFVQEATVTNGMMHTSLPIELLKEFKKENLIREDYR